MILAYECVSLTLFAVAFRLEPAPEGLGTHTQLGLPPCLLYQISGVPCPACGMTTAFAHFAHGHPLEALVAQPFGVLLALALAAGCLLLPAALAIGRSPRSILGTLASERLAVIAIALFLASWIYKVLR
jgi:hypothetical protein